MGKYSDLIWLIVLAAITGLWLKMSRLRELAIAEARRQCERHGLQLLDETVGLRGIRLRKLDGQRVFERGYAFEVSIDGNDREPGRIWFAGGQLTGVSLPTIETRTAEGSETGSNVVPFRRLGELPDDTRRLH
ncbi:MULTISPECIES: DUF3301 domain-containing protein [Dyella]|uniref:DUF3301 domain-containing protein n=2 Tax=Dyella TaxID=231454 RepID=A0A4R0YY41_9GAMM|nr:MULTISPECIES: DUF3301 domain-containing protein [Dyella]TBR40117.1 DUF3301 domain-containing protein [Dyella terrae]TCI12299.1 DUF3301 domain-containing protein [Dyella soli]